MLVKPTVADLKKKVGDNRYSLVIMTARRARQIASGAEVKTKAPDKSPVTLAADEIFEGKVTKVDDESDEESSENNEDAKNEEN